jgi:hypothetical protein
MDYLRLARMIVAPEDATVARVVDPGAAIFPKFIEPLATAILNTDPREAAARPLARVLGATLLRGERACRPAIARAGLSKAFVDPALAFLERAGAVIRTNCRLVGFGFEADAVVALDFGNGAAVPCVGECVVLATPAWSTGALVPDLPYPTEHRAIVNAHFRLPSPPRLDVPLLGLVAGTAQWLVIRDEVVSVTVSAADALLDVEPDELLRRLWTDVAAALGCSGPMPPARLIKEKRATFAQTPAAERLRPEPATRWKNLILAGDWVATGLPATIEGAIRSGAAAARLAATQC